MYGILSERAALTQASFNAYNIILTWLRGVRNKTSIFGGAFLYLFWELKWPITVHDKST